MAIVIHGFIICGFDERKPGNKAKPRKTVLADSVLKVLVLIFADSKFLCNITPKIKPVASNLKKICGTKVDFNDK
jgi:hypothetical protein